MANYVHEPEPTGQLQRLLPRHYSILDLTLAGNGPAEIAQALGMTATGVGLITRSAIFQHELSRRREKIEKKIDEGLVSIPVRAKQTLEQNSLLAAERMVGLLDAEDPRVVQQSAKDILDRVLGPAGGQKADNTRNVVVLEAGAIQLLQLAITESKGVLNDCQNQERIPGDGKAYDEGKTSTPGGSIQVEIGSNEETPTGGVLQASE